MGSEDLDEEDSEVNDDGEEDIERCKGDEVAEEQQSPSETTTERACSVIEELSLAEQEERKNEVNNVEDGASKDEQKMPQGITITHISLWHKRFSLLSLHIPVVWSPFCSYL